MKMEDIINEVAVLLKSNGNKHVKLVPVFKTLRLHEDLCAHCLY